MNCWQACSRQGYAVDWLADGRDAAYQGRSEPYDLIILDLGLPGLPGLEVLAQWRASRVGHSGARSSPPAIPGPSASKGSRPVPTTT